MASNVLPQAFFMVPTCSTQCSAAKKLAFTAAVPRRRSFAGGLISSASTTSYGFNFSQRVESCGFLVRAEANAETEIGVEVEADNVESIESEEVLSEDKLPAKPRIKLGDVMGILNRRAIDASDEQRPIPDLRTGDVVEIKLEVPENRRRLSIYKGIVISRQNAGIHTTIRIRRIIAGVGVEIVFPIYSPNVKEIKVLKHRKVRRARLYYLRDKLPRLSTFK